MKIIFSSKWATFKKKLFFGRKFQPKKILRKNSKIFDFWKMTPRDDFWSLYFHSSYPSLCQVPSHSMYKLEARPPTLTQPPVSATNAPSLLNNPPTSPMPIALHIYQNIWVLGGRAHNLAFLIRTCKVNFFSGHRTLSDGKIFWLTLQALVKFSKKKLFFLFFFHFLIFFNFFFSGDKIKFVNETLQRANLVILHVSARNFWTCFHC